MTLDDVLERATILFPRQVARDELDAFFKDLARSLNARITYFVTEGTTIRTYGGLLSTELSSLTVEGHIQVSTSVYDSFKSKNSRNSPITIESLQFSPVREYTIPPIIQLWDDTRTAVDQYFEEHQ